MKPFKEKNTQNKRINQLFYRTALLFMLVTALIIFHLGYSGSNRIFSDNLEAIDLVMHEEINDISKVLQQSHDHLDLIAQSFSSGLEPSDFELEQLRNRISQVNKKTFFIENEILADKSSISGLGHVNDLTDDKLTAILQAGRMTPLFAITKDNLPNLQWIYFISKHQFINLYPYATAGEYLLTEETMKQSFYILTEPGLNPYRRTVMTPIYNDEAGKGLMVTLTKPVYIGVEYQGALALDFTLNEISDILNKNTLEDTEHILYNEHGEIIAKTSPTNEIIQLDHYLDQIGIQDAVIHDYKETNTFKVIEGYLVKVQDLPNYTWKLVSIRKVSTLIRDILLGQSFFIMLIVSLIICFLLYRKRSKAYIEIYDSQLKFEQVINQTVQLTGILDREGKILFANKIATEIIGEDPKDLVGKDFSQTAWWNWSEEGIEFIEDAINKANQGQSTKKDVVHYDTNGQKQFIEFSLNPIYTHDGSIEYLVANGKNITDRIKLNESIEKLSKMDMLTNLGNRRGIMEVINEEISRFTRSRSKFSILLCDVDHFKKVNDTYGHNIGDHVLMEISQLLLNNVRAHDEVGRWGGEEFLVILPDTEYKKAIDLANRIREQVATLKIEDLSNEDLNHITMTIGVAEYHHHLDINELIQQADEAMYYGKRHGRNQVIGYKQLNDKED